MFTSSLFIPAHQSLHHALSAFEFSAQGQTLIQVFSSLPAQDITPFAEQIVQRYPDAQLVGLSTGQIIHNGDIHHQGTLLLMTQFAEAKVSAAVSRFSNNPVRDTQTLVTALALQPNTQAILCFAEYLSMERSERIGAFNHLAPNVPVAGGAASDGDDGRWVLLGTQTYRDAMVAVALHGDTLHASNAAYTEWNPIGRHFRVTKTDGKTLYRLDDMPVQEVYNRYLGDGQHVPFEMLHNFPLIKGDLQQQDVYVPMYEDEPGIVLNQALSVGDEVRFCFDHPSLTLEQVYFGAEQLRAFQPEQIFVYNCTSRLEFIEENQELLPLQSVAPTQGCYCMGELWHDGTLQRSLHHSMTYLALREGDTVERRAEPFSLGRHDVIAPLFSLIRNSLSDLDEMNHNLAYKIQSQASMLTASYRVDPRTGLPNRVVLREKLLRMAGSHHLLALKLTNFNQINEKYGYQVGDRLLQDLSAHFQHYLQQHLPGRSELFAIGVGEWATLFRSEADEAFIHLTFSQFVDQLEHVNFEPFGLPEVDYVSVSLCAGLVSRRDFPDKDPDDLLLRAIEARRHAHQHNRHFCNASQLRAQEQMRQERLGWLSCVSRAVLDNNVLVYAQPIYKAHSHELASLECLVRIDDDGEIILPGRFLPIIEGTHLYTRLSRQMINRTFDLMRDRHEAFSINLAPQDFMSERTLLNLEEAIKSLPDPSRVGLEVLETEQIKDYGHMIEVCNHFRSLGASIIVDDFGSGYSNIDEIVKLEPQVIKLDGSLIRNIDQDIKQRRIAQQLVQLCQVLNAKTVAEFVHNDEVRRISEAMGVDYLQGFHLGAPQRLG
ncbi:bifunctional diguanylate cyclase/phosphodiesterase [Vibrio furnissii]|uniref:bifunctional diguanylate cyclase/phosphodiesterase n=1 Tax=Vibrio furnissii TaxID=29494 RepID=UPI0002D422C5|nr:EAL domain-containing protein [Vibrio furnissii]UON46975.1 EAL domain-containing protein [Vibrio furnissii]SUP47026.1 sensory box/GGDEF family protein [Vibrio furnissii]